MPAFTFLEECSFNRKTVVLLTAYGENVLGRSLDSTKEILEDTVISDGLAVQEHHMQDLSG